MCCNYQLCTYNLWKMTLQLKQYVKSLSKKKEENVFLLPWGGVVLRNCDDLGDLLTFHSVAHYREEDKPLWLLLSLVLFRDNVSHYDKSFKSIEIFSFQDDIFQIYSCSSCEEMQTVQGMRLDQTKEEMESLQCVHSKAAETFFMRWDDHWTVNDLDDEDMSYTVFCNQDIKVQTFHEEGWFLSAIQIEGEVTLLFTVGRKQKYPMCSKVKCSKQAKCICYKKYKKILEEEGDDDDDTNYYWDKRSTKKPVLVDHFLDSEPDEEHFRKHGYNRTSLEYPIKRSLELQDQFLNRLKGSYDVPENITPKYDEQSVCQHGTGYTPDDDKLILMSPNLIIYTETIDRIFPIPTYGRPTAGNCKCILQADTHNLLLWNMGSGNFIDYLFLHNHFHKMVSSGIPMNASFNARKTSLSDIGLKSSLSYSLFLRACTGYAKMIQFKKEDFLCPNCGDSPKYIVCDGKTDGPTKRKLEHLKELDRPEDDETVLCQGSLFEDRVFLSSSSERKLICNLLTSTISSDEFLDSEDVNTENGRMISTLVERIALSWPDEIPKPYNRFLANVCKYSSVAGFLQVSSEEPLNLLAEFCQQRLDIRAAEYSIEQKKVAEELPALWPNIVDLLNVEKSNYLPDDVSPIILKLIEIRKKTFLTAAVRCDDDYIEWENIEKEHPTQYYPNWPIWRYPKKYVVRNVSDCDFCNKSFDKHRDFSYGVFSVGCACSFNITYGYEIMLCKESAHNIFRLLMCRDVDLNALQGVIFDHACGLDQYLLNREPREFEYLRCLVDGAHWQV